MRDEYFPILQRRPPPRGYPYRGQGVLRAHEPMIGEEQTLRRGTRRAFERIHRETHDCPRFLNMGTSGTPTCCTWNHHFLVCVWSRRVCDATFQ